MHEVSIVEGIREVIEAQIVGHDVTRVTKVRLEIGRFAGVEKPALEFAWDIVMRGGAVEGAALEVIDLPGRATCFGCGESVEIDDRLAPCPLCGGARLVPTAGEELRIKDLEAI